MKSARWFSGFALAIIVSPALAADPVTKTIILAQVEVRSGPSEKYYSTSMLRQGDTVEIVGTNNNGWLEIKPPLDSFDMVNASDVEAHLAAASVIKATLLRVGSALDSSKVDVALRELAPGTQITLLGGLPQNIGKEQLIKIRPPADDLRFIPPDAVSGSVGGSTAPAGKRPNIPSTFGPESTAPDMAAAFGPTDGPSKLQLPFESQNTQPGPDGQNTGVNGSPGSEKAATFREALLPARYDPPNPQQQNATTAAGGNSDYFGAPPQSNRQQDLIPPATNGGNGPNSRGSSLAPTIPPYNTYPITMSRSNQMAATLSNDPQWNEAERLETLGDVQQAIEIYDKVGRAYGQSDPNLALRAMNRAQYLRNAVSAGATQSSALSRSAKSDYTGTATTNVHPDFSGKSNVETVQPAIRRAKTDVYPETPKYLPDDAAGAKSKAPNNLVTEIAQPTAKLTKPIMPNEAKDKAAQKIWYYPGILEKTDLVENGKSFYRLRPDDTKQPLIYCTNEPGVDLEAAIHKRVLIYGPFYMHTKMHQYYMEVQELRAAQ